MPFEEFEPPIEPGEALGAALFPYGALLPALLNPALGSDGAEGAPEDVDEAPGAVPSVPADGTVLVTDGPVGIRETLRIADANEQSSSSYAMEI